MRRIHALTPQTSLSSCGTGYFPIRNGSTFSLANALQNLGIGKPATFAYPARFPVLIRISTMRNSGAIEG
jgi:hypothetical protein